MKCAPPAPRPFSCLGFGQTLNRETPDLHLTSTAFPGILGGGAHRVFENVLKVERNLDIYNADPPPPAETSSSLLTKKNIFSSVLLLVSHGGPALRTSWAVEGFGRWGQKVTVLELLSDHTSPGRLGGGLFPLCPQQCLALGGRPRKALRGRDLRSGFTPSVWGNNRNHKGGKAHQVLGGCPGLTCLLKGETEARSGKVTWQGTLLPVHLIKMGPLQQLSKPAHWHEVHEPVRWDRFVPS